MLTTIEEILTDYNITSKIVKIVTDSGSNFIKAMKEDDTAVDEKQIKVINLAKILKKATHIQNIPLHQPCAAHTLNICMTTALERALKKAVKQAEIIDDADSEDEFDYEAELELDVTLIDSALNYRNISQSTFKKAKDLWNRQSRSSLTADVIKEMLGMYLITPNDTRWNSLLDSLTQLLSIIKKKPSELKEMFKKLRLEFFTGEEIEFIESYVLVSAIRILNFFIK